MLGGATAVAQNIALRRDDVRAEQLPLPCPAEARLDAADSKLRAGFVRMLVNGNDARQICVGVVSRGQVLAPSTEFLKSVSRHGPAVGLCGCRPWDVGVRVVVLPEMSRRKDGTLVLGTLLGSAAAECTYTAYPEANGWRVDGTCQVM
jgi:hypothetical protein